MAWSCRCGSGDSRDQAVSELEIPRQHLPAALRVLARANEPPVLVGGESSLTCRLRVRVSLRRGWTPKLERRFDPVAPTVQDLVGRAGQVRDAARALVGQHLGLPGQAVVETPSRRDMERRRLLVVEGTEALHRAATSVAEGGVAGDDVVDARLLAHLRDVLLTDAACPHGGVYAAAPDALRALRRLWTHPCGRPTSRTPGEDGVMTLSAAPG